MDPYPYPDPDPGGQKWPRKMENNKILSFEMQDVLF
jgi:hypothetical protein